MADEEIPANDEFYFDPVHVIDSLTNSLYYLNDCQLPEHELEAISKDFTSVMYQCTKLIKAVIKQNIKSFNEEDKNKIQP